VSADAKYSKEPETGIVTSTSKKVTVNKVWENDEESDRPTEISVQLLCDGTVYDTVTLSADNSWTYTWPLLDNTKSWTVVEESVPDGYSVSLTNTEDSYTLTNTGDSDFKSSSKVKTSPPTGKIKTDHSPKSTKTKGSPGSRLPKTGQLWWPITILAAAGMILILVGLIRRKRSL
jgi:LPXTG-motif cell wall-anchored protein